MRLIDEILTQCSYIDLANSDPIDYVGLSVDCYNKVLDEASLELRKKDITSDDLNKLMSVKFVIIPELFSINYIFLKEVRP